MNSAFWGWSLTRKSFSDVADFRTAMLAHARGLAEKGLDVEPVESLDRPACAKARARVLISRVDEVIEVESADGSDFVTYWDVLWAVQSCWQKALEDGEVDVGFVEFVVNSDEDPDLGDDTDLFVAIGS
jgi:hypothetical protein